MSAGSAALRVRRAAAAALLRRGATAVLLAFGAAGTARAQAAPDTASIEFVGLKRWTVQMIRDTMALKAPGSPLGECAVVLEGIGFPSASAEEFIRNGRHHIVVTVVEPEDSARVRPRPERSDSSPDRPAWGVVDSLLRARFSAFATAVSLLDVHRTGDAAAERIALRSTRRDSIVVRRIWAFLDAHRAEADLDQALWVLATDGNSANLAVAVAILGNFPRSGPAWWTLMDAQRSSRGAVASTAIQVLGRMTRQEPPVVDWTPAAAAIRAILGGTNVFALAPTLNGLRATRVSPDLAGALLRDGNGELVLAYLGAQEPYLRDSAHGFLVQISGRDLGYDEASWARWIATLN